MSAPEWFTTDWKKVFFAAERRLSPKLEQLVRTDAALDALDVATGLTRFAARTVTAFGYGLVEPVGLPSSRQVRRLHRSVEAMVLRTSLPLHSPRPLPVDGPISSAYLAA